MKRGKNKKGLSPVVATVLLIGLVIVLGLIIFMWFQGIVEEPIKKRNDQNVKVVCRDVAFDASYNQEGILTITNTGNIPIYDMRVITERVGGHSSVRLSKESDAWNDKGLNSGASFSNNVEGVIDSDAQKVTLVPVLLGETSEGRKDHVCNEETAGYELSI